MNDQERVTDLLQMEKKMSNNYDIYASECVNMKLRDTLVSMIRTGHDTQTALFDAGSSRGWYTTEPAEGTKINQAYQKFASMS